MNEQHIWALAIYAITSWFAWILQTDMKNYRGNIGPIIVLALSLASIAGRIITLVFVIRLFWVDAFSWYTPILIAIAGEVANIIILTPLFVLITRRNFLLMSFFDLVSIIGVFASLFFQSFYFRQIAT